MASIRSGSFTDSNNAGGFSYAQAAKGRSTSSPSTKPSSSAVSGVATPAMTPLPDLVPGSTWADEADASVPLNALSHRPSDARTTLVRSSDKGTSNGISHPISTTSSVASPDVGTPSISTSREDDSTSIPNSSSETTWDSKSQASEPATKASDPKESTPATETSDEAAMDQPSPPTPAERSYKESRPPAVNPWAQRMEAMKTKTSPVQTPAAQPTPSKTADAPLKKDERAKTEPRKKRGSFAGAGSDFDHSQGGGREPRKSANSNRSRDEAGTVSRHGARSEDNGPRRGPPKAENASAPPPPVRNDVSWPEPRDVLEEDKKKAQESHEKTDKERSAPIASKGTKWTAMPYVPSAVFETQISTRGGPRLGRGGARGGAQFGGRGGHQGTAITGEAPKQSRATSLTNGDAPNPEQVAAMKADREAMPPPSVKNSRTPSDAQPKGQRSIPTALETSEQAGDNVDSPSATMQEPEHSTVSPVEQSAALRRNNSVRKVDGAHQGAVGDVNAGQTQDRTEPATTNGFDDSPSKSALSDRRGDSRSFDVGRDPQPFGSGSKRGGRRGGARGMGHSHNNSGHQYPNGYPDYQGQPYGMPPQQFHASRGGQFQQNRNSYRGGPMRSQSLVDGYGRPSGAYPAGPMVPQMQGYLPDYYGNFPAAAYPYFPASDRDLLAQQIATQLEYYFSIDNMVKDVYLRKHMDSQGYIFLDVISSFKRVKELGADYELVRAVCAQSSVIEIRVGDDGKDRVREVGDWERWLLPIDQRDESAKNEGPKSVRFPMEAQLHAFPDANFYPRAPASAGSSSTFTKADRSYQMANGGPPPFYPSGHGAGSNEFSPVEEVRGRQAKTQHREGSISPLANSTFGQEEGSESEPDKFLSSHIENLTVVVRKHELPPPSKPYHTASSRTFSNGSIDSRNIMEEVEKSEAQKHGDGLPNGDSAKSPSAAVSSTTTSSIPDAAVTLFWVKDKEGPVEIDRLPEGTTHEMYTTLRAKAVNQREQAATGTCPYDMDVLYQFWSHFLIRNFNTQMYNEFAFLAGSDLSQRHSSTGMNNLVKYYSETLSSQIPIRERIARDFTELVRSESGKADRPAFKQLRAAWRNGALNLKNRKKLSDMLDSSLKTELEA